MQRLVLAPSQKVGAREPASPRGLCQVRADVLHTGLVFPRARRGGAPARRGARSHSPRAAAVASAGGEPIGACRRAAGLAAGAPAGGAEQARAAAPAQVLKRACRPDNPGRMTRGHHGCDIALARPNGGGHAGITLTVIAPGAGTRANAAVYADLGRDKGVRLEVVGQSGSQYDRYPACWPQGSQAPNLDSFSHEVMAKGIIDQCDCLILGSRGGQVVLPSFWRARGAAVPPAVVINGGCAMKVPASIHWPETAVTFLLLGGQDSFRGGLAPDEYVAYARSRVPKDNKTTALLYVHEMGHMPQAALLGSALRRMIGIVLAWKSSPNCAPAGDLACLAAALGQRGWNGCLWYTAGKGAWQDIPFGFVRGATDSIRLTGQRLAGAKGGA